ncbi:Auxin-responsive protein IAA30 [Hibiscus syriacus]|uniref:Auxin-responsive protein n=1 Tax=Hibiscus syriacus TaxID=106335 RepID=A0A6A3CG41_HIBSY|nr:auxin-responsive protein IAA30-like [Hibiscus syriacus]KAE8727564.1 Auxin-responsive protein IAA30 [Hibiscus syriacus]
MGRARATSCTSSIDSTHHFAFSTTASSSSSSQRDLSTDLRLGRSFSISPHSTREEQPLEWRPMKAEQEYECNRSTFFVKVYMEGIPIGRKLDVLGHESYYDLITTLQHMFHTNIIWAEAEVDGDKYEKYHVLTYEDKEGDWMMVGDVPWEIFLSAVRRLKITKCSPLAVE